jgi:hypothetical protein
MPSITEFNAAITAPNALELRGGVVLHEGWQIHLVPTG